MNTSHRAWVWIAFFAGLLVGIPVGAVGIIVVAQVLAALISLP